MKKLKLVAALLVISQCGVAQNLFTKGIAKLGQLMAPPPVMVSSLDSIMPTTGIASHVHPVEVGSVDQAFYKGWKSGADLTYITFMKQNGTYVKINGTVTIDGKPVEYVVPGFYSTFSDPSSAAHKVEVTTASGQKATYNVEPFKSKIKILSINGMKDNISLDLTKDVEIELENTDIPANSLLQVSLAINQVSIKSMYGVCYIRNGNKLTIPAAAFRNIGIKPGGSAIYSYKKSYLNVGIEEKTTTENGSLPPVIYTKNYDDGKFVTISKEPDLNLGLVSKGKEEAKEGDVNYDFYKPNAFFSRPTEHMKKAGIISFGITGSLKDVKSEGLNDKDKNGQETWRTTTITFPEQPKDAWKGILQKMYPDLITALQEELKITVVPKETITKAPSYNTISKFTIPESASGLPAPLPNLLFMGPLPYTETMGSKSYYERVMAETGTDALITFRMDFWLEQEGHVGMLVPKLTFEMVGKPNGPATAPTAATTYYSGTVTGKGIPSKNIGVTVELKTAHGMMETGTRNSKNVYSEATPISQAELERLVRRSDIITAFRKGLKEIKEKEKANTDYQTVWNLQK